MHFVNTITLDQILSLVGTLDDTPGENTPRERFRTFLRQNVAEVGQIRDYVEQCLRTSGTQYARALQDLINHLGQLLGFKVTFGRYQGVQGKIGFDGHWVSPKGFHAVVEVKTTEVYSVQTSTLLNYMNQLVSESAMEPDAECMGIYIIGKPDPNVKQLHNSILAEKKTDKLRIISADSILSLAELTKDYDISHSDLLDLLRPSIPTIDPVVNLMLKLVNEVPPSQRVPDSEAGDADQAHSPVTIPNADQSQSIQYWLAPVKSFPDETAETRINKLVKKESVYAFSGGTPARKRLKPGDRICFYAAGKGVVAYAKVQSEPKNNPHPAIGEQYPWTFKLSDAVLFLDKPIIVDQELRSKLNQFQGRDVSAAWGWFVVGPNRLDKHDFELLTNTNQNASQVVPN